MVRRNCPKITAIRGDLLIAAAGDHHDSSILFSGSRALGSRTSFRDALDFVRAFVGELRRVNGPPAAGPDSPHKLGVALMGCEFDGIRLVGFHARTGEEMEQIGEEANWLMALDDRAMNIGGGCSLLCLERYKAYHDVRTLLAGVEAGYRCVSELYPERIGGAFYWARVGLLSRELPAYPGHIVARQIEDAPLASCNAGTCGAPRVGGAMDVNGNLILKNISQSSPTSATTTSATMTGISGVSQTIVTKGNKVDVTLSGSIWIEIGTGYIGAIAIYRDGSQIGSAQEIGVTLPVPVCIRFIDAPNAGSHTYSASWQTSGGTLRGDFIYIQAVELG